MSLKFSPTLSISLLFQITLIAKISHADKRKSFHRAFLTGSREIGLRPNALTR